MRTCPSLTGPLAAALLGSLAACGGGPAGPECTTAADCPGTSGPCQTVTCSAGACGLDLAPAGPVGVQTPGDCREQRCDGAGHLVAAPLDTDLPADDGDPCTQEACAAGVPGHPAATPGTACGDGGQRCDGLACVDAPSCKAILAAGAAIGDGSYTIDPDGAGAGAPFQAWCDMTTDGGGWTLVTSVRALGDVTPVDSATLVSPAAAGNVTNRGMALPDASELLVVQRGLDPGFEDVFDRADRYSGVTGLGAGWDAVLGAFNLDSGFSALDTSYAIGAVDGWAFDVARVNTTGCLQVPLRDGYGNGNYLAVNAADGGQGYSAGLGLLYHHWGNELWVSGAYAGDYANDLRCDANLRYFEAFWKGLYLR